MPSSPKEISFIRESLEKGIRLDLRGLLEERIPKVEPIYNSQGDGCLLITKGHTKVKVDIQFMEISEGLIELKLIDQKIEKVVGDSLCVDKIPLSLKKLLENWLSFYKIGLRIDLEIVNDDGNVYEAFIYGLREILKEIEVPDILNLEKVIKTGIELPKMKVMGFYKKVKIVDPLLLEEEACDYLITFIENNNIWTNKCGEVGIEELEGVFK